jgi:hypothetical protein
MSFQAGDRPLAPAQRRSTPLTLAEFTRQLSAVAEPSPPPQVLVEQVRRNVADTVAAAMLKARSVQDPPSRP